MQDDHEKNKRHPSKIWSPEHESLPAWRRVLAETLAWGYPRDTFAIRWGGGWLAPLILAAIAIPYFFGKPVRVWLRGYWHAGRLELDGHTAVAFGVMLVAIALVTHFNCFWSHRNEWVSAIGKLLFTAVGLAALGKFAWGLATVYL